MDTIKDINDKHGLEVQIMEFGQVPKQIFNLPHPRRVVVSDLVLSETLLGERKSSIDGKHFNSRSYCLYKIYQAIIFLKPPRAFI